MCVCVCVSRACDFTFLGCLVGRLRFRGKAQPPRLGLAAFKKHWFQPVRLGQGTEAGVSPPLALTLG